MVHKTLGVDLSEDYYSGEFFDQLLVQWVDDNVSLIKTIPANMLDDMRQIVKEGYENGMLPKDMAKKYKMSMACPKRMHSSSQGIRWPS